MDIQWFPGHMAKTRAHLQKYLKLVDVVIEVVDARIPGSSRNPMLEEIIGNKSLLVVLNKADLADPEISLLWERYFKSREIESLSVDSVRGTGVRRIITKVKQLAGSKTVSLGSAGRLPRAPRCMVVGIPNSGKSFLINRLAGKMAAKTENRPGVTKGQQWVKIGGQVDLLDTPGILWPKFNDREVGYKLALTGAIKSEVFNVEAVAGRLAEWLASNYPECIRSRYKINISELETGNQILVSIGESRGLFQSGRKADTFKAAMVLLKEFREGLLGRFTLDRP